MTPEQLKLQAKARRRRAEAEAAQASGAPVAPAAAPNRADAYAAGQGKPSIPARLPKVNPWTETPKQFASGAAEGVASIPDQLGNMGSGPGGITTWGVRQMSKLGAMGAEQAGLISPETSKYVQDFFVPPEVHPFEQAATSVLPAARPDYTFTRKAGKFTGSNLPFAAAGLTKSGLALVPEIAKTAAKESVYGTLGAAGDSGGRMVAEKIAPGNEMIADVIGTAGSIGGQLTPHAGGMLKAEGTKKFLGNTADPETAREAFAASERLGITDAVAPATFGGDNMKTISQWLGMLPFVGGRTGKLLRTNADVIQNRLTEVSNQIRNGQAPDVNNLPINIQDVGDMASRGAEGKARGAMQTVEEKIGGSRAVNIENVDEAFGKIYNGDPADAASGAVGADYKPGIDQRNRKLEADRKNPVDQGLHTRLTAKQAKLEADLVSAKATLKMRQQSATATNTAPTFHAQNRVDRLTRDLETTKADIHKNLGPQFGQLKGWNGVNRTQANAQTSAGGEVSLGTHYAGKLTDAGRTALQGSADSVSPAVGQEYRDATGLYDLIMDPDTGAVPRIRKGIPESRGLPGGARAHTGTAKQAYDWLTDGKMNVHEKFKAMQDAVDHAMSVAETPEAAADIANRWAQVRGDLVDQMGQKSAGNRVESSETPEMEFSGDTYATNSETVRDPTKEILTGGDAKLQSDMRDLGSVSKSMKATGREQNASRTQKHAIITSAVTGGLGGLGTTLLAGGLTAGSLGTLGGALVTPAVIKMIDRFASNPQTSRDLVFGAAGKKRIADLIERAKISGLGSSAASSSMADQFGGPR